jgi:replication factor C subunit 1
LGYIVENFGGDIRQTINYLDLCSRANRNVNDIKKNCEEVKKDKSVTVSSFDICKILLNKNESSKLNFGQKLDLFFVDFDLIPNMIHENYISTAILNNNSSNKKESLEKIIEGLDHMSIGDTIENRMKSQMEWSLLPDKGIHTTVIPSMIFSSYLNFPKFPEYFNKMSKMIKTNRQLIELKRIFSDYSLFEIKNLVGPLFYNIIVEKIVNEGKNGLDGIVDIFAHYRMNSNMFKENLYDIQSKENQAVYNKINTSIKTALTKKLNERFKTSLKQHKTRTIMMPEIKVDKDGNLLDDYDYDDVDEEEADDQSSSFFEPIKKKTNKKKN